MSIKKQTVKSLQAFHEGVLVEAVSSTLAKAAAARTSRVRLSHITQALALLVEAQRVCAFNVAAATQSKSLAPADYGLASTDVLLSKE